ncbi:RagB/SusD family nutrient uptake outer membrane protein [Mucilaginibacter sp. cycad4]|uniref:RagB/SusD family nutrient uptake outer membrane protein n=1 Tax=Mucilaginibacter sp. cycad4 TaxID=3342096 RepID=UPI002AABE81C|nr:RagB/SusD family nutrient uptake outer membrane protein [Mucilaginibacter gossypii]WPV02064.1 RagB/SusD family nutrient uptake outer membrane protein [Mucilaginibacter gossypii]
MKKTYIILALTALTAASCKKDFIDLTPKDSYTDAIFYKTVDQFKQADIAAYAPLRDVLVNDYFTSEMRSDNTIYQAYPSNRGTAYLYRESISNFTNTSTNDYVNAVWQHCYTGISRTNIVINRLTTADFDAATKAPIDGQAKFLRAFYYFKLVRLFGGVPLFLKEVTKAEDAFLPRSAADAVYTQIIADAKDAISELSVPAKFPQTGEATKGSATMLLAEVYATQKKWADTETLLSTLSGMGYGLNADYADAFKPGNKNSKESIFDIQFLEGTVLGTTPNPLPFHFLPRSTNTSIVTGININNSSTGGWNTPTQDLINAYEPNDKRLDASIGIVEGTYNASDLFVYSANKSIIGYTPAAGKMGVPYIKKYEHPPLIAVTGSSDNFPVYRYSDALLLLAEAQNEQGKSPLTALNTVRSRAGLPTATAADQASLRDIIAHERRIELAFENHRWNDLVRTGKAIVVMNAFGAVLKTQVNYLTPDTYNVTANKLLYPIPQPEIDLNPGQMTQNPGY